MTPIKGIEIEKNAKGEDAFIRIDLEKYGKQLEPFLREVGLVRDRFEKEWNESLTMEQVVKEVSDHIKSLPWKK